MSNTNLYPARLFGQRKWTGLFCNKSPDTVTYDDVEQFRQYLHNAIHVENLSPKQIAARHNFESSNFGTIMAVIFKIKLKDLRTAQKNSAIQKDRVLTDAKSLYYKQCGFKLSQQDVTRVPGFDLLIKNGMYHPVNNPNGMVRDHILSRSEGYQKGYDPAIISHPANCQFITNYENIKKNSASDITYEQLLVRIQLWNQEGLALPITQRRKVAKLPEHVEKIRASINARYQKIKAGEIPALNKNGKLSTGGRPETFSKKYNWTEINVLIEKGFTLMAVSRHLQISYDDLKKAKYKGLIKKPLTD